MFENQVAEMARLRARLQIKSDEYKARKQQFEDEVKGLYSEISELNNLIGETEAELRSAVVETFNQTGDKHPHPALGIRLTKSIEYDTDRALGYAMVALPDALKLDTKVFTKVMKDLAPAGRPEFVREVDIPVATIATDLSEYMPMDQEAVADFDALQARAQEAAETLFGGA